MTRTSWRVIATGVAATVLAGCQVEITGTGRLNPDQVGPTTTAGNAEDPAPPQLRGTATCEVPTPPVGPDGGGAIVSTTLEGTGDALKITIELSEPPAGIQDIGVEIDAYGDLVDVGVTFTNGAPPFQYSFDPYTGDEARLTASPTVDGTTVTYSVSADILEGIVNEDFRWYAYNATQVAMDTCPPTPADGSGQTTVNFPPL